MDNLLDTQLLSDVRESLAVHKQTPRAMWRSAVLIALSSLMMGFSLASLNSCLVLGGNNSSGACYHGDDDSSTHCPKGSMYTDIDLNTCKLIMNISIDFLIHCPGALDLVSLFIVIVPMVCIVECFLLLFN